MDVVGAVLLVALVVTLGIASRTEGSSPDRPATHTTVAPPTTEVPTPTTVPAPVVTDPPADSSVAAGGP